MDISVIIPCHNEEENVALIMEEFKNVFSNKKIEIEYIFVDDGSKDNTFAEIKKLMQTDERIEGIKFYKNFGKEAAIYAGLSKSTGKYVAIIDGDLQQHPKYILEMYNYIIKNKDYDCVCCYQDKRKESAFLSLCKKIFYKLINKVSDVTLTENASDFRLFTSEVKDSLLELKEHYRFSKGLFAWGGYNTYYMPYEVEKRKNGKTSWSFKALVKYATDGILDFTVSPLKISTYVGIILILSSIVFCLVNGLIESNDFIILFILFFSGLNSLFLGIIGEYLGRVYMETKNRPLYVIKENKSSVKKDK